ncbi:hypothetical protein HDU81_004699 [Chytriomyces hyalinus]|nr:hypothetical protein HDU81_004699 [Chytriomyces hyalinus]
MRNRGTLSEGKSKRRRMTNNSAAAEMEEAQLRAAMAASLAEVSSSATSELPELPPVESTVAGIEQTAVQAKSDQKASIESSDSSAPPLRSNVFHFEAEALSASSISPAPIPQHNANSWHPFHVQVFDGIAPSELVKQMNLHSHTVTNTSTSTPSLSLSLPSSVAVSPSGSPPSDACSPSAAFSHKTTTLRHPQSADSEHSSVIDSVIKQQSSPLKTPLQSKETGFANIPTPENSKITTPSNHLSTRLLPSPSNRDATEPISDVPSDAIKSVKVSQPVVSQSADHQLHFNTSILFRENADSRQSKLSMHSSLQSRDHLADRSVIMDLDDELDHEEYEELEEADEGTSSEDEAESLHGDATYTAPRTNVLLPSTKSAQKLGSSNQQSQAMPRSLVESAPESRYGKMPAHLQKALLKKRHHLSKKLSPSMSQASQQLDTSNPVRIGFTSVLESLVSNQAAVRKTEQDKGIVNSLKEAIDELGELKDALEGTSKQYFDLKEMEADAEESLIESLLVDDGIVDSEMASIIASHRANLLASKRLHESNVAYIDAVYEGAVKCANDTYVKTRRDLRDEMKAEIYSNLSSLEAERIRSERLEVNAAFLIGSGRVAPNFRKHRDKMSITALCDVLPTEVADSDIAFLRMMT